MHGYLNFALVPKNGMTAIKVYLIAMVQTKLKFNNFDIIDDLLVYVCVIQDI